MADRSLLSGRIRNLSQVATEGPGMPVFSVVMRDEGIIHVKITGKEEVDLDTVKKIIKEIGEKTQGQKRPILITSEYFTAPGPETRRYMAAASSNPYSSASAYITRTFAEKLIGNAYIQFNKPARPTRMFTSENKAIEWLKTFL
jgi:hypothetical protein